MCPTPTVLIPDPSLVLLVGAAGAGKSTLATRRFAPEEILSSDTLRARLGGDPANQSVSGPAFAILHREAADRLRAARLTVIDATNVDRRARSALLALARSAGVPTVAIVLDLPTSLVLARNGARAGRSVPDTVVHRQLASLRASVEGRRLESEGFATVVRLTASDEVDALVVVRAPASS